MLFSNFLFYLCSVKIWRIIWAIYISTLTIVPCEMLCCHDETEQSASVPDDQHHEEACSPFYACSSCYGFTLPQPYQIEPITYNLVTAQSPLNTYQAGHTLDVFSTIWHPPCVS